MEAMMNQPAAAKTAQTMKAIVHDRYGAPDVLEYREIARPAIGEDEVLIRVHAAAVHIGDLFCLRGAPFVVRMDLGWTSPKNGVRGFDAAGVVEAVGSGVTRFKPGDEVFGSGEGTLAEFARAKETSLAPKPAGMTFEQAAAMPTSGLAALHALRDVARVQPGQRILINGASGGVGLFAVQIAKWLGARVTGVCSTANVELVRSMGADRVIDYTREDFTQGDQPYDAILDNVENHSLSAVRRVLAPRGTLIVNSGTGASGCALFVRLFKPLLLNPFVRQNLRRYLSTPNQADMALLKDLAEAGQLRPFIGRTYPLPEAREALMHLEGGHAKGKVVISVRD